ncbi:MAG: DNA-directed RNA polymerase subunit D [Candidatus Micrarchaeia archaeon]
MKLVLDKKHGNRIEFIAKPLEASFANMLRRYSMSRVPVLAIDEVVFYDNSSAFWDEYIGHRLGLIPLTTPDNTPASAEVLFSLDAEGPKTVYASDMVSADKDIAVTKGNIVVVTLGPNQHLRFEAKAVLGTGRSHAKFQAGLVSYGVDGSDVRFMVESFYQMEPSEVLLRGCDVIERDIELVEEALGKKSEKKKKAAKKKEEEAEEKKASKKKAKDSEEKSEEKAEEAEEKKE